MILKLITLILHMTVYITSKENIQQIDLLSTNLHVCIVSIYSIKLCGSALYSTYLLHECSYLPYN